MALVTESAGKVRQKAEAFISTKQVGTTAGAGDPIAEYLIKALFLGLAANKGNPDLQFLPFSEVNADVSGGTVLLSGACRVYAVYTRKENSATDNWTWVYDDATDDTTAGDALISLPQLEANADAIFVSSVGIPAGTGIVITQYTTALGTTDGSNGADGFVIVGAP